MNLLQETQNALTEHGYTPEDIRFIGSQISGHSCTWEQFLVLADVEYGLMNYGINLDRKDEAEDLIIVFNDGGRLYRRESYPYGWDYNTPFIEPKQTKSIYCLVSDVYPSTLEAMNPARIALDDTDTKG